MMFKVLSVFANAGLKTDNETYVVAQLDTQGIAHEIYTTTQSHLGAGHNAQTLCAAFCCAWKDVQAPRRGHGTQAYWQLEVKRHKEFDGGESGWEAGARIYLSQGAKGREEALQERRMRRALYLLALHPRHMEKFIPGAAADTSLSAAHKRAVEMPAERSAEYPAEMPLVRAAVAEVAPRPSQERGVSQSARVSQNMPRAAR